jgi:hypothetical protein
MFRCIYNDHGPDRTAHASESGRVSQVVWWSDRRAQKYLEHRAENHLKYLELTQMEKRLKCPKRPKRLNLDGKPSEAAEAGVPLTRIHSHQIH